jgi:hypothetical protein
MAALAWPEMPEVEGEGRRGGELGSGGRHTLGGVGMPSTRGG